MSTSNCEYLGHDWHTTTSNTYRLCTRCQAAQRFVNDAWVDVARVKRTRKQPEVNQHVTLL